jgi:hypothetical protein
MTTLLADWKVFANNVYKDGFTNTFYFAVEEKLDAVALVGNSGPENFVNITL